MTPSVTLLGTGKMGAAFVDRWLQAGREVVVWNRNPASAHALAGAGVKVEATARDAAQSSPVVVSMLTNGPAVIAVLLDSGALAAMPLGSVLVDLSTIDVASSVEVARAAVQQGVHYLRGGVSGTPAVVRSGNAALLLSGPPAALAAASDVMNELAVAQTVVGDADEARVVKIAVNSMLGGTMQLLAEATALSEANGVDRGVFLDALDHSVMASRFVAYKGAALRSRDYAATFTTADLQKDIELAARTAADSGVTLPVGSVVLARVSDAVAAGYGAHDFLSLYCTQQRDSGLGVDLPLD